MSASSSSYDGPIIDSHIHYWHPTKTPREVTPLCRLLGWNSGLVNFTAERIFPSDAILFFASPKYITKPYLPDDYSQDVGTQPVTGVVHVEAGWKGKNPVDETRWLDKLDSDSDGTKNAPGTIKAIVAHVDLTQDVNQVEETLKNHVQASRKVRGIRHMIAWHDNHMVYNFAPKEHLSKSSAFRASFPLLAKYNLTFETFLYSTQLEEIKDLAQAFPNQKILIDHIGTPVAVGGQFGGTAGAGLNEVEREKTLEEWKSSMLELGRCPNVYVKLSGLGMPVCGFGYADSSPPAVDTLVEHIGTLILFVIQVFQPRRCMFASNFPVDKVSVPSVNTLIQAYKKTVEHLPLSDQELIFHGSATEFYRLNESNEK